MQGLVSRIPATLLAAACLGCLLLANQAMAHPGIDEQIAELTRRIAENPNDASLYLRRGELHRIHRDWPKAEADYKRARELDPQLAIVDQAWGRLYLQSDRAKKALAPLERYLAKVPTDTTTLELLSRTYVELDRHMEAANAYARTLASVAEGGILRPEYYLGRARALAAAGEKHRPEAVRCLDDGLRALDHPVTLQLYAIELELELKRHDAALSRLDQISSRSARKESWLVRQAEILEQAGRPEQAREAYRKTLEAIAALPASRAANRAVERLKKQAEDGLERLKEVGSEVEPSG